MEQEPTQPSRDVEPLTQSSKKGILYRREPEVEAQIRWALSAPKAALLESLANTNREESGYLKEETLVYLIRAYHQVHDNPMVEALWATLYPRCVRMIRAKLPRLEGRIKDGYQEVQTRLFEQIIHPEGETGDFLQVRFWKGFQALVISVARAIIRDVRKEQQVEPLANLPGHELEQAAEESEERLPGSEPPSSVHSTTIPIERLVIGAEGLQLLPEPIRKAYVLHYGLGYPIESKDQEMTVSSVLGKSPRTIHNWLDKAEEILNQWRGDQHD